MFIVVKLHETNLQTQWTANDMTLSEAEMRQGQITPEMIRFLKKFEVSRLHILDLFVSKHSFVSHNYRKIMRHNKNLTAASASLRLFAKFPPNTIPIEI